MLRTGSKRTIALIFALIAITSGSATRTAISQGLKGAPANVRFGLIEQIDGRSDDERWQKLLSIEKNLIGMTREDVEKRLGPASTSKSSMQYLITESKKPSHAGEIAELTLSIKLVANRVESFTIEPIRWAN